MSCDPGLQWNFELDFNKMYSATTWVTLLVVLFVLTESCSCTATELITKHHWNDDESFAVFTKPFTQPVSPVCMYPPTGDARVAIIVHCLSSNYRCGKATPLIGKFALKMFFRYEMPRDDVRCKMQSRKCYATQ